jgi:hypothetical protein
MPLLRMGAYCCRCGVRPAKWDLLCSPCWQLLYAFGHDPAGFFERGLRDWLRDAA